MIGIIGGSGLYNLQIDGKEELDVKTPFGEAAGLVKGKLEGKEVVFLARHGKGHVVSPSEINYRANIFAFKKLGVNKIVSLQAVGSLKEELKPKDIVIPDQIIDRTKGRASTFFEGGIVAHVGFADPFCSELSKILFEVSKEKYDSHMGGTYLVMEGPQFSTRAESNLYRSWNADIIGMTCLPEAKLAREAEICYAAVSTVTDYDVWKEENVSVEMIIENIKANEEAVMDIVQRAVPKIGDGQECGCGSALAGAVITSNDAISGKKRKDYELLIGKYL